MNYWQPLTDEQIDALLVAHGKGDDGFHAFARAVEREVVRRSGIEESPISRDIGEAGGWKGGEFI